MVSGNKLKTGINYFLRNSGFSWYPALMGTFLIERWMEAEVNPLIGSFGPGMPAEAETLFPFISKMITI